ncbi:MAG: RHS repeat-associated core domain-containing protein, partial [Nitrososphaerota archaeon]
KAGRLIEARETPQGGSCTTRAYAYDADSNRTSLATHPAAIGGICSNSGGTTQSYEYDGADRLMGEVNYDSFGRITSLPGKDAGGKTLATSYFSTDMVATQSQNGITNSFQLDASLRQRQRLQGGGLEGTEVFHYDGPGDSPAWTQRGSTWTRSIAGIGGELAAVQESGKEITLQLTNAHGDVSATAPINPEATSLETTLSYDPFGNPTSGSAERYGWLGGKQRRTELPSGVIQMGVRSYVPAIGRFISTDPVRGGSASAYDYANADPVDGIDIEGLAPACSLNLGPSRYEVVPTGPNAASIEYAIGFMATCTRNATHRSLSVSVVGGVVNQPIPGIPEHVPRHGSSTPCRRLTCTHRVSGHIDVLVPCDESAYGYIEAVATVSWTPRGRHGSRRSVSIRHKYRVRASHACS